MNNQVSQQGFGRKELNSKNRPKMDKEFAKSLPTPLVWYPSGTATYAWSRGTRGSVCSHTADDQTGCTNLRKHSPVGVDFPCPHCCRAVWTHWQVNYSSGWITACNIWLGRWKPPLGEICQVPYITHTPSPPMVQPWINHQTACSSWRMTSSFSSVTAVVICHFSSLTWRWLSQLSHAEWSRKRRRQRLGVGVGSEVTRGFWRSGNVDEKKKRKNSLRLRFWGRRELFNIASGFSCERWSIFCTNGLPQ